MIVDPRRMSPEQIREQATAVMIARQRAGVWKGGVTPHVAFQKKPLEWIVTNLGVPENTIRWSLNPEYQHCSCSTVVCNSETRKATGGAHVWDGDRDPLVTALEAIAEGKSVAVSAGTTTGKSYTLGACCSLWVLACFQDSLVLSLAPKFDQLLLNLWKEMGKLWPRFKGMFPGATIMQGKLRMREGEGEQEVWAATAFGAGVGAEEDYAQRLKGTHAAHMFWIIEEMPGVEQPKIDTVIKTATAAWNPILGMGQPAHQSDPLANFGKREWVVRIRVSALDYPNVVADREVVPGGRSKWSVERDLADADHDENDAGYLSQVRGIAPQQAQRALIRWSWCEAAAKRWDDQELRKGPLALGIDVADSPAGDDAAISRWQGAVCTEVDAFKVEDASRLGEQVYREMRSAGAPVNPKRVGVDTVGVGASTYNKLRELGARVRKLSGGSRALPTMDVEARWSSTERDADGRLRATGPRAPDAGEWENLRAQMYWRLREDLRLGRIGLPDDRMLFEELTVIQYDDTTGKVVLDPKKKIRARLGRSPDRADAVVYGNWVRARRPEDEPKTPEVDDASKRNVDRGLERLLARHQKRERLERARHSRALHRHLGRVA